MNNMSGKPIPNFPRDSHRSAVTGTDLIVKMPKWSSGFVAALFVIPW